MTATAPPPDAGSLRRLQVLNLLAVGAYTASTITSLTQISLWNSKDATLTPGLEFGFARLLVVAPLLGFARYQFNPLAHPAVHAIGYRLLGLSIASSVFNHAFDWGVYRTAFSTSLAAALVASNILRQLRPLELDSSPAQHAFVRAPFWAWHAWSAVALAFAPSNVYSLGHPPAAFFALAVAFVAALAVLSVLYAADRKRGGDAAGGAILLWYAIELCCYHRALSLQIAGWIASVISGLALAFTVVDSVRTAGRHEGQISLPEEDDDAAVAVAPVADE